MPELDSALINQRKSHVSSVRALHCEYEARLKSPNGKMCFPKKFSNNTQIDSYSKLNEETEQLSRINDEICHSPRSISNRSKYIYSDRFIPSRSGSHFDTGYSLIDEPRKKRRNSSGKTSQPNVSNVNNNNDTSTAPSSIYDTSGEKDLTYSYLLKSELLGIQYTSPQRSDIKDNQLRHFNRSSSPNIFRFKTSMKSSSNIFKNDLVQSSVGNKNKTMFSSPRTSKRKIAKTPYKVLDAPALQDDFYLNLVDWSSSNVLAVGLGSSVYLWSACTSKVTKLCDLGSNNSVTSVAWTQRGTHVAVGTSSGNVQIWEASSSKIIRTMSGHAARVGTLAWNSSTLASGSRDRLILQRDLRSPDPFIHKFVGHKQEVCGLKWSFDNMQLASGGNDNKLMIWNASASTPVAKFSEHTAAVKAIAWSPHQHGLLASGGGTADRCIRFWNSLSATPLNCIDTGSQVCNLMWSKNVNEIVSTHGYSLNQIIIWRYPSMTKLATLTGHTYRVLYLAMSPDGQTIVTGAGDETLRFWNAFPGSKNKDGSRYGSSLLFPIGTDIR